MLQHRTRILHSLALVGVSIAALGCFGISKELQRDGIPATATILEVWDTGWTVNDDPVVGMKVQVQPADRPAFEARIEKTTISRLAVPQFQPGTVIPVRFDPKDPTIVAVDPNPPTESTPSSGNPYRDRFVRGSPQGASFLQAPSSPELFLGTADSAADTLALIENDYGLIGGASVLDAPDVVLALAQAKEIGASLVVVYGHFNPPPGASLNVLPYRPRSTGPGQSPINAGDLALVGPLGPQQQAAMFWGKLRPPVLGVYARSLNEQEKKSLQRSGGVVIDGVSQGSPAAAAHIELGDIIVAVDGQQVATNTELQARLQSLAGRSVRIDVLRHGTLVAVIAELNPAAP